MEDTALGNTLSNIDNIVYMLSPLELVFICHVLLQNNPKDLTSLEGANTVAHKASTFENMQTHS